MKDDIEQKIPGEKGSCIRNYDKREDLGKYFNREGPQQTTIPSCVFTTCSGCKYHSFDLIKSGINPIYADNCKHPESDKKWNWLTGNLHKNFNGVIETPGWCPFLKPKENKTEDNA